MINRFWKGGSVLPFRFELKINLCWLKDVFFLTAICIDFWWTIQNNKLYSNSIYKNMQTNSNFIVLLFKRKLFFIFISSIFKAILFTETKKNIDFVHNVKVIRYTKFISYSLKILRIDFCHLLKCSIDRFKASR